MVRTESRLNGKKQIVSLEGRKKLKIIYLFQKFEKKIYKYVCAIKQCVISAIQRIRLD